ncbi:MAG: hypothetical protein KC468_37105, partial [Myxococcales bacterium]|nr:hypothetical protein [Myxococcales bacterium]
MGPEPSPGRSVTWFETLRRWLELVPAPPGRPVDPDILRRPDLALAWLAPRAPLIRAPVDALAPLQIPARCGRSFVVTDALDPGILEPEQLEEALTDGDDGIVLSAAGP